MINTSKCYRQLKSNQIGSNDEDDEYVSGNADRNQKENAKSNSSRVKNDEESDPNTSLAFRNVDDLSCANVMCGRFVAVRLCGVCVRDSSCTFF
jgi:hypothetical protein